MSEFDNVTAPPPPPAGTPSAEDKQWGMFAHLSALSGIFTCGLGGVIGPLIIWQMKKDASSFVADQGKESLNFNITVLIATLVLYGVGTVLLAVIIGFLFYLLAGLVGIAWLVFTIIAGIKANNGEAYRYPFALRLIK